MRDININHPLMKIQYSISWVAFVFMGLIGWIIAFAFYLSDKGDNIKYKKGILNRAYQKFIFIYGSIWGDLLIILLTLRWLLSL